MKKEAPSSETERKPAKSCPSWPLITRRKRLRKGGRILPHAS